MIAWQPDYAHEARRRWKMLDALEHDLKLQAIYLRTYENDPIAWINDWCVTFDPRAEKPKPRIMPFLLFPRQEEFVMFISDCMTNKESGLIEKSRDMGATWLCCALSVWLWLFRPGTIVGWGSLKAEQVDKLGDMKAIFPKIRLILSHLPPWMMPNGFRMKEHATHMRVINPANNSSIIGESGDSMGRGGRSTLYFKDESAHYEHPEDIEAALGDNTDVQIDMSSVNGSANPFYRRRMAGAVWYPDKLPPPGKTWVFIFDWRDNPLKSLEWYERRRAKAEAEGMLHIFAQEVDRDYAGSVQGIIIRPEWSRACIDAHLVLGFDDSGKRVAGQDVADGGSDKNALGIVYGVVLRYCDQWGGEAGAAAEHSVPIAVEHRVGELYYDSPGVGSGFKTQINNMRDREVSMGHMQVYPWNPGGSVLDPDENIIPGDIESPTNKDQYANIKAQGYWRLRTRIYKTYRAVVFGEVYPFEELCSFDSTIPRLMELLMQLSQPVNKTNLKGKSIIDKQPNGAVSPNLADCVNIAYNPTREISIFDTLL